MPIENTNHHPGTSFIPEKIHITSYYNQFPFPIHVTLSGLPINMQEYGQKGLHHFELPPSNNIGTNIQLYERPEFTKDPNVYKHAFGWNGISIDNLKASIDKSTPSLNMLPHKGILATMAKNVSARITPLKDTIQKRVIPGRDKMIIVGDELLKQTLKEAKKYINANIAKDLKDFKVTFSRADGKPFNDVSGYAHQGNEASKQYGSDLVKSPTYVGFSLHTVAESFNPHPDLCNPHVRAAQTQEDVIIHPQK